MPVDTHSHTRYLSCCAHKHRHTHIIQSSRHHCSMPILFDSVLSTKIFKPTNIIHSQAGTHVRTHGCQSPLYFCCFFFSSAFTFTTCNCKFTVWYAYQSTNRQKCKQMGELGLFAHCFPQFSVFVVVGAVVARAKCSAVLCWCMYAIGRAEVKFAGFWHDRRMCQRPRIRAPIIRNGCANIPINYSVFENNYYIQINSKKYNNKKRNGKNYGKQTMRNEASTASMNAYLLFASLSIHWRWFYVMKAFVFVFIVNSSHHTVDGPNTTSIGLHEIDFYI